MDTWVLRGRERASGEPFCFAFCGAEPLREYQGRIALAPGYERHHLDAHLLPVIPALLRRRFPDCSAAFFEIDQERRPAARFAASDVQMPVWMPIEIEVRDSLEATLSGTQHRMITRKVKSHRLSAEIRTDPEAFEDFYWNMYRPYIAARHGPTAVFSDYDGLKARFAESELVMVAKDGQSLGAYLVDFGHAKPRMLEMGIRDGREEYLKMGVPGAAYLFSFARILEKGGATAVLGTSRGYLKDGPLTYKLSLGASFGPRHYEKSGFLHLRVLNPDAGLLNFLVENPFVQADGPGRYAAVAFVKSADAAQGRLEEIGAQYGTATVRPRVHVIDDPRDIRSVLSAAASTPGPRSAPQAHAHDGAIAAASR